jgi:branched-chain amino acid transport system ATP-binding protein
MTAEAALLELTGVSKRFGRITVAESLSLRFRAGETVGIVGPNGAGKSSLFGIISGDLAPDAGDVAFDGRSILRLDPATRCRMGIARTYQVPRPFENMTVFENLLVAAFRGGHVPRHVGYALAANILEETGLSQDANRAAGRLGLLQRKRLELARSLATQPRIVLLDEVAGGLTDPEVAELVAIVDRVRRRDIAVVWVEHVVHALTSAVSRLICLAGGRLIAEGEPEQVLDNPEVKEVYLGADYGAEVEWQGGNPPPRPSPHGKSRDPDNGRGEGD